MPGSDNQDDDRRRAADKLFAQNWQFFRGVPSLEFLPPADRPEIAFAGRSNVGKSSLINALLNRKSLARTSNTPGRTQELNFFLTETADFYLVDMPGYGFAKAPKTKVDAWTDLIKDYLRGRPTLRRVYVLIDARHGIKPVDETIFALLDEAAAIYQIVLTKIDKIKPPAVAHVIAQTEAALKPHAAAFPEIIATSSEKNLGLDDLRLSVFEAIV
jgi:GTP-binding protein